MCVLNYNDNGLAVLTVTLVFIIPAIAGMSAWTVYKLRKLSKSMTESSDQS